LVNQEATMFDRSHLTRLITLAVMTCAATWMLAASALAHPDALAGGTAPSAAAAPAYQASAGDTLKTPNTAQVDRVLAGIGNKGALPHSTANGAEDVDPLVIVLSLFALVAGLGAATLIVTRRQSAVLRA